jgi:hypothetical protein
MSIEHVAQVGGSHYEAPDGTQHWDVMEAHDVDYLAANATKYICRFDRKGTARQDLEKAKSYLQRMLQAQRGTRRLVPFTTLQRFYTANALGAGKRRLLNLILEDGSEVSILSAVATLAFMIEQQPG